MQRPVSPKDLTRMPYAERQLLVFVQDSVWDAEIKAERSGNRSQFGWSDVLKVVSPFGIGTYAVIGELVYAAYKKMRESGTKILTAPYSWAQSLSMLPGHPRDAVLYVAHPVQSEVYFPTADFHRFVFEHKFAEALKLLMHLGARKCVVKHQHGWSRDFASTLSAGIPSVGVDLAASGGTNSANNQSLLFEAEFEGHDTPEIPDDLIWFQHEPTWRTLADGRLKFGLRQFSLQLNYNDDFSVHAGLKLKAEKAGFDLGGKFTDHVSTSWSIAGTFE
jgi:hypothetical protein